MKNGGRTHIVERRGLAQIIQMYIKVVKLMGKTN